ncbi:MAG: hypothetical protein IJ532_06190 [Alphaproteobacteria bacterium]|nr:hypothetical protein [Alphaproteobacteria bacterium]
MVKKLMKLSGKPYIRCTLAVLLTLVVLWAASLSWLTRNIVVSFISDSVKNIEYQVFYTEDKKQSFNAEQSVRKNVNSGKQEVKIVLPVKKIVRFRLDFGHYPRKVTVERLKIKGNSSVYPAFRDFSFNHIKKHKIKDDMLIVEADSDDPFITYKRTLDLKAKWQIDWCLLIVLTIFPFLLFYKLIQYLTEYKVIKNYSRIDIVFLALFFALLFLPMLNISKSTASEQENRVLASKPHLLHHNHKINVQYGALFEKWYNDHFMGRKQFIKLYNGIKMFLEYGVGNDKILVGKDGWLFFKPNNGLANYANKTELSETELRNGLSYLRHIDNWCKKNNKKFYYFIAPDKHRIYGEHYRFVKKVRSDEFGLAEQFVRYIRKNSDIKVIYPRKELLKRKNEGFMYYKDDTHWSPLGGYYGYIELMKKINDDFQIIPIEVKSWQKRAVEHHGSDLLKMLNGKNTEKEKVMYEIPQYTQKAKCSYKDKYHVKKLGEIECRNDDNKYSAFILRDSFFNTIIPYLADSFKNVRMEWKDGLDKKDLADIEQNYDIIILENVERYTPRIFKQKFTN